MRTADECSPPSETCTCAHHVHTENNKVSRAIAFYHPSLGVSQKLTWEDCFKQNYYSIKSIITMTSILIGSQIAATSDSEITLMTILSDNLKMDNKIEMKIDVLNHKILAFSFIGCI